MFKAFMSMCESVHISLVAHNHAAVTVPAKFAFVFS